MEELAITMAKQRARCSIKARGPFNTPIARIMHQPCQPKQPEEMDPPQSGALVGRLCYHQATECYLKALREFHTKSGKALLEAADLEPVQIEDIREQSWRKARRHATKINEADRARSMAKHLKKGSKGYKRYHLVGLAKTAKLISSNSARDKHLKSTVAGRKQLKERRRLELQRSWPRRRTLRRWAKKQSDRLSHQARQHLEERGS